MNLLFMTAAVISIATNLGWYSVNDTVMGGRSSSQMQVIDNVPCFTGFVSLANNGGFASVRHPIALNNHPVDTVEVRVKGDGKQYQLRFRQSGSVDGIAYTKTIDTVKDQWLTIKLHESEFTPVWRGRRVPQQPPLSLQQSRQIGLMISNKQDGEFALCVEYIHFSKQI